MPSALSHAVVAVAIGRVFPGGLIDRRALRLGAVCSMIPDLDVIGFTFGIRYGDLWGHRGMTHSLLFAVLLSAVLVGLWHREQPMRRKGILAGYLFACTASHGVLDAMTNGGLGIAFFSPFDTSRYFFSFRPVLVSPIEVDEFVSVYGLQVLASEALWIWLPALVLVVVLGSARGRWLRRPATDRPR